MLRGACREPVKGLSMTERNVPSPNSENDGPFAEVNENRVRPGSQDNGLQEGESDRAGLSRKGWGQVAPIDK
jgi:hypothetical protein